MTQFFYAPNQPTLASAVVNDGALPEHARCYFPKVVWSMNASLDANIVSSTTYIT